MEISELKKVTGLSKFEVAEVNYSVNIPYLKELVLEYDHLMIKKDNYSTYFGIGLQYNNPADPFYDAVQQKGNPQNPTILPRFNILNEIGLKVKNIIDDFADEGVLLERGRILKAAPLHEHTPHMDNDTRIHIPVTTNDECFMFYYDKKYHLEVGKVYIINAWPMHHFRNLGKTDRYHITFTNGNRK